MRTRSSILLATLALVIAACAGSGAGEPGEGDTTPGAETTTTVVDTPEEMLLSYDLAAGDTFVYEVDVNQTIDLTTEGEGAGLTGDEDLPGSASVEMTASGTFTFSVADGPEAGTYAVTITSDLTEVTASGDVDGEPISEEDVPEFAEIAPVETTVIVDEQGNLIPESPGVDDPLSGLFGGMGDLGSGSFPGAQLGQFFGPPFADEEVTVGDSWATTFDTPGLSEEPITTSVNSTVTGTDTVDGSEVLVIETQTEVGGFEFDFGEFLIGMFTGFMPEDPTTEEQAEIDALVENLRFIMSFDDTVSDSTTYFDAEAGLTRRFETSSSSTIGMDVNFPDEETGELSGFVMDMSIAQTVVQRLVTGPTT